MLNINSQELLKVPLEGTNWVRKQVPIPVQQLQKLYKGPTPCYVTTSRKNEERANVFAAGTILGFLSKESFSKLSACFQSSNEKLETIIRTEFANSPQVIVQVAKRKEITHVVSKIGLGKSKLRDLSPSPIEKRKYSKQKHPITKIAFAAKRNNQNFFGSLKGIAGIYCIYSNDFATYIGQAQDIGKRLMQHVSALKRGAHQNLAMQHAWNAFGSNKFTFHVIEKCELNDLDELEHYYIEKYQTYSFGYNSTPDGQGSVSANKKSVNLQQPHLNLHKLRCDNSSSEIRANAAPLQHYATKQDHEIPNFESYMLGIDDLAEDISEEQVISRTYSAQTQSNKVGQYATAEKDRCSNSVTENSDNKFTSTVQSNESNMFGLLLAVKKHKTQNNSGVRTNRISTVSMTLSKELRELELSVEKRQFKILSKISNYRLLSALGLRKLILKRLNDKLSAFNRLLTHNSNSIEAEDFWAFRKRALALNNLLR